MRSRLRDVAAADRLTYDDDLFLRARRVLGIPVVNQTVWRFAEPVPLDRLREVHARLGRGSLSRLAVSNRVPGARSRWVAGVSSDLEVQTAPVAADAVLDWAEERASVDLDPELGPTWVLSTAVTTDGEGLLSLVTSHVVCDGGAHVASWVAAVEGTRRPQVPGGRVVQGRRRDDVRDAASRWRATARGVRVAARAPRPVVDPTVLTSTSHPPTPPRGGVGAAAYRPPTVVLDLPTEAWHAAARAEGGTGNTLLVAVSVETLTTAGRVPPGSSLKVALPVDTRPPGDARSNATTGVSVVVDTAPDGRVRDLAHVRVRSKEAFAGLAAGTRVDPLDPLKPLVQMLPDRVVARAARSSAVPLCLCSNLGRLVEPFRSPFGTPATAVLMRSVTQGVTPDLMRSRRGGLSTWLSEHGDAMTLAVLGMDPDHWPDPAALREHLAAVLQRRGLPFTTW